jgi:sugar lactone lactonase YvrE
VYTPGAQPRYPSNLAYGPRLQLAAAQDRIFVGFSNRYEIQVLSPAGDLTGVVRLERSPRLISADEVTDFRTRAANAPGEDGLPASEGLRQIRERLAATQEFAEQFPAFSRLLVDREGNLWVLEYGTWEDAPDRWGLARIWTPPGESRWDVFQPDGLWLGTITMPPRFVPLEIGGDYVLGLARDADDIEQVRLHRLVKP